MSSTHELRWVQLDWLWGLLYGNTFEVDIEVPYGEIAIIVASLAIPVAFGMLMKWKKPEFAERIVSIGGIIGIIATE